MPSLIILVVGVLALPPFVLPVPPLPWKWPALFAMLYAFVWLLAVWQERLDVNIIYFWVYLQGLLLILRPAFPLERVKGFVPFSMLSAYAFVAFVVWRLFQGFELSPLNLLILTQGVLALSCYMLPVTGRTRGWALPLSMLYGLAFIGAMWFGIIEIRLTNFLILFLGVIALERFLFSGDDPLDLDISPVTALQTVVLVLLSLYILTVFVGWGMGEWRPSGLNLLIFSIGLFSIVEPLVIKPSRNSEAFKALLTFNLGTNYPYQAVKGRDLVTRAGGNPYSELLAGPGIVFTDADHAVIIYTGGRFNRVAPPGITFTRAFEMVRETVDLRPQIRSLPELAVKTKDGIDVNVEETFIAFRVNTKGQEPRLGAPFPYDRDAVRNLVHTQRVASETDEKQGWDELVRDVCEETMRDIISEKTLDELRGLTSRRGISAEMRLGVRRRIDEMRLGLELLAGSAGEFRPVDGAVIQQRIRHWQAHWESDIASLRAEAQAEEEKLIEGARADGQRELLSRIIEGLDPISGPVQAQDRRLLVTVVSLLEAIEQEGAADPALGMQGISQIQAVQNRLLRQNDTE
jgi:hypothetical protein